MTLHIQHIRSSFAILSLCCFFFSSRDVLAQSLVDSTANPDTTIVRQPPAAIHSEAETFYQKALESFRRGQSESTIKSAIKCIEKIESISDDNEKLALKAYKLLITSYKNTDQDGKANKRFEELYKLVKTRFSTKEILERKLEQVTF